MIKLQYGDRVIDGATGRELFYLDDNHKKLVLVDLCGNGECVSEFDVVETMAGWRLSAKAVTRIRPRVKKLLEEEASVRERGRKRYSFGDDIRAFDVARLVRLLAAARLSLREYMATDDETEKRAA